MIDYDENIYYSNQELDAPEIREERLFKNLSTKLKKIHNLSKGWNKILKQTDLSNIKNRHDLEKVPITRKSDLAIIQAKSKPYGELTTKKPSKFPYIFASPGPIYEPGEGKDFWNLASSLYSAGLRPNNLVYNTFSYHLGPAGIMFANSARHMGAYVMAGGIGNTDAQLETIQDVSPDFYIGTPSFLKILLEKAKEKKINISSVKKGLVGAEPLPFSLRENLKDMGVNVMQMYGTAEVGCIAYETKDLKTKVLNDGMIVEENIILEIVRPGTNTNVRDGEIGEVVITKLTNDYPMIRLATGDLSAVIKESSPCGRTNIRIKGWMGRAEQSTKFKGIFITPKQVNDILLSFKEIYKVRLVLTNEKFKDKGTLVCEVMENNDNLKKNISAIFKSSNKVNLEVSLVKKGSILNDGIVIEDKRTYK